MHNVHNAKACRRSLLLEARQPIRPIRLAVQLVSPPKRQLPIKGLERFVAPPGIDLDWLVRQAWHWRNTFVTPEEQIAVRVPEESEFQALEKVAPNSAALYRQRIVELIELNKRMKLTRTIAKLQQLIVDQYGWPERG